MGLTRAISPLSSIEAVSFDGQNSQRSPLPRIGVIYASNPYDRSMFGDRILGSVGAAYLICLELQREFPDCGLLAVPEFARDLSKVEIGDAIPSLSEEHYEYAISIEPDPNSPLMRALEEAQKNRDATQIDLEKTAPLMQAVLRKGEDVLSARTIRGTQIPAAVAELLSSLPPSAAVLVEIPYSPFSEFDRRNWLLAEGRAPLPPSLIDLADPEIRRKLLPLVTPNHPVPQISFLEGHIPAMLHVRTGRNIDSDPTIRRYPAKFPSLAWYVDAIGLLQAEYPATPIHIHIATDNEGGKIRDSLESLCRERGLAQIRFSYTEETDFPPGTNLMEVDLWGAKEAKAVISADSSFGAIVGLYANPDFILTPELSSPVDSAIEIPLFGKESRKADSFENRAVRLIRGRQVGVGGVRVISFPAISQQRDFWKIASPLIA